ncbi:hypothetical protein [Streptomyces sp. 142MFCol3.1]|uniref:hypothetical protein n=1 Tax=Streptomyces sp. 142MFCol3.1 TaxID=1172179 RepID=UPI001319CDDA|nr:hypothetical protein [Streptomyces sp. 142MFCol3.1]
MTTHLELRPVQNGFSACEDERRHEHARTAETCFPGPDMPRPASTQVGYLLSEFGEFADAVVEGAGVLGVLGGRRGVLGEGGDNGLFNGVRR